MESRRKRGGRVRSGGIWKVELEVKGREGKEEGRLGDRRALEKENEEGGLVLVMCREQRS